MTYFFILGNNPSLSIAEIINTLCFDKKEIKQISRQVLLVDTNKSFNIYNIQNQLGGVIKIGQVVSCTRMLDLVNVSKHFINILLKLIQSNTLKKVYFGFSVYKLSNQNNTLKYGLKTIGMKLKQELKNKNISSRWVSSKQEFLSSVIVQKNKLLTHGAEITFILNKNQVLIGKTISCQEFEQYSFFDFSRPHRLIKKGMLPPKLGQIMINLGINNSINNLKNISILDPFCGTGTILQQAILMGCKKIVGSDKSDLAINNTKENIEWLIKQVNKTGVQTHIFQSDVINISKKIKPNSIDLIITEPYLGPLKIKHKDKTLLIENISNLYINAFKELKKVLKYNSKIVIIFPVFKFKNTLKFLPILNNIKNIGYKQEHVIQGYFLKYPVINITNRDSVIYSRPSQKVLREIFIFKNK